MPRNFENPETLKLRQNFVNPKDLETAATLKALKLRNLPKISKHETMELLKLQNFVKKL